MQDEDTQVPDGIHAPRALKQLTLSWARSKADRESIGISDANKDGVDETRGRGDATGGNAGSTAGGESTEKSTGAANTDVAAPSDIVKSHKSPPQHPNAGISASTKKRKASSHISEEPFDAEYWMTSSGDEYEKLQRKSKAKKEADKAQTAATRKKRKTEVVSQDDYLELSRSHDALKEDVADLKAAFKALQRKVWSNGKMCYHRRIPSLNALTGRNLEGASVGDAEEDDDDAMQESDTAIDKGGVKDG